MLPAASTARVHVGLPMNDEAEQQPTTPPPPVSYFPAFTPVMPPPLIGSGNFEESPLVISSGGFGEPRTSTDGDFPSVFPAYTAGSPPFPNSVPATPPNIPPFVPWPPPDQAPFPSQVAAEGPIQWEEKNGEPERKKSKGKRRK